MDVDFPEVPAWLVAQRPWRILRSERWLYPQAVHLGEARVGSECLLHRCLKGRLHRVRVLRLGDNMGVVLAFGRKRASAFQLLCQVRRSAALELACEIDVRDRWFPSETNPSDPPSRFYVWAPRSTVTISAFDVCKSLAAALAKLESGSAALLDERLPGYQSVRSRAET